MTKLKGILVPRLLPEAGYKANKKVGGGVGIMLFTDTLCSGGTHIESACILYLDKRRSL